MKIEVLFFGITRDLMNASQLTLTVKKGVSIKEFKNWLQQKHPKLKNINSYAIAVNEAYTKDTYTLNEKDIVAIIPPVSGG